MRMIPTRARARGFHSGKLPPKSRRWRRCLRSSKHLTGSAPTKIPKKASPRSSSISAPGRGSRAISLGGGRLAMAPDHHERRDGAQSRTRMENRPRSSVRTTARTDRARPRSSRNGLPTSAIPDQSDARKFCRTVRAALRRDSHAGGAERGAQRSWRLPAIRRSAHCGHCAACRAISLPLLQSTSGLPIGVQLVGPRHGDARLLRTARWLAAKMAES